MRVMRIDENLGSRWPWPTPRCPSPGPGEVLLSTGLRPQLRRHAVAGGPLPGEAAVAFRSWHGDLRHCRGDGARCRRAQQAGTRVAAYVGHGGLADYRAVPATRCIAAPAAMTDEAAAGFLIAYGTSHVALAWAARLRPGETLLVLGASGGVGLTAVEIGALMGARVIAVARDAARLEIARAAGAHYLVDGGADIAAEVKALGGADVVYDPVGGASFDAALRATRSGARLLPLGFAGGGVPQVPANYLLVKDLTVLGLNWAAYTAAAPEVFRSSAETLFAWFGPVGSRRTSAMSCRSRRRTKGSSCCGSGAPPARW